MSYTNAGSGILIDTGFLLALAAPKDHNHHRARSTLLRLHTEKLIVVAPALTELFYMVQYLRQLGRIRTRFSRVNTANLCYCSKNVI